MISIENSQKVRLYLQDMPDTFMMFILTAPLTSKEKDDILIEFKKITL